MEKQGKISLNWLEKYFLHSREEQREVFSKEFGFCFCYSLDVFQSIFTLYIENKSSLLRK